MFEIRREHFTGYDPLKVTLPETMKSKLTNSKRTYYGALAECCTTLCLSLPVAWGFLEIQG